MKYDKEDRFFQGGIHMTKDLKDIIHEKLSTALNPVFLKIVDDSDKHQGHAASIPGQSTHFRVKIVSKKFEGLSHLQRHRLVYQALNKEMKDKIHALALTTLDKES